MAEDKAALDRQGKTEVGESPLPGGAPETRGVDISHAGDTSADTGEQDMTIGTTGGADAGVGERIGGSVGPIRGKTAGIEHVGEVEGVIVPSPANVVNEAEDEDREAA